MRLHPDPARRAGAVRDGGALARPPSGIYPLTSDDAAALRAFELENRVWFRTWVPDRGDEYFSEFCSSHRALLSEQDAGASRFWLVRDHHGEVVGRVNLVDISGGEASLGYRIGRRHVGRGYGSSAVALVLHHARELGLQRITAHTTPDNIASAALLRRAGFRVLPPDDGVTANGSRAHVHFLLDLQA